jgi:hypothetical protein
MAARLSALRASRSLPSGFFILKDSWYSFLLEAESTPGPVRPEGLGQFKKSTSSGCYGEEKNLLFSLGIEPQLLCRPGRNLVPIPTGLSFIFTAARKNYVNVLELMTYLSSYHRILTMVYNFQKY